MRWHGFPYLGSDWGQADGPKFPGREMADYVRKVNADGGGGGALTIDVGLARHVDDAGRQHVICKNHLDQLAALARARRQP